MLPIVRYAKIYAVQLKNNWVREAVYRTNFITAIWTDVVWIAVEFLLFTVIYSNVQELAGWTKDQVFFFLGMFFASDALYVALFQRNYWNFSALVNKGELDILLTKPVNPLFLALTRWIGLTAFLNLILGLLIMIRFAEPAGFSGGILWFSVLFWIALGCIVQLLVRFTFTVVVFWTDRSFAFTRLYYQMFTFASKPDTIYPKFIRYALLTAVPFAFIASVPSRSLLHGVDAAEVVRLLLILMIYWGFNAFLWRRGLKRYQSASS